jgi:anti-sigma factor (TIGR02949 family)
MSECSCREAFEKLEDFLDRELTTEELSRVEAHLCACVECAEAYRFEGRVLECVKAKVGKMKLPKDLHDRVIAALDECET